MQYVSNKKLIPALATLLVLVVFSWAVAQTATGPQILVDKDRNAVISTTHQQSSTSKGTVTSKTGTDLASGLSTVQADLELAGAEKDRLKNGDFAFYSEIGEKSSLVLGSGKLTLPPDLKMTANADAKFQQTDKSVHADAKFDVLAPNPGPDKIPFKKLSLDGSNKTDYKTGSGKINFSMELPDIQKKAEVKSFKLTIADSEKDNKISTSIELAATVDATSAAGRQIQGVSKNIPQTADLIKRQLTSSLIKLDVESVTIGKAEVSKDDASIAITIKISGLRGTIATLVERFGFSQGGLDVATLSAALSDMLSLQFDKFDLDIKFDKDTVSGQLESSVKNVDKALTGYATLMESMQSMRLRGVQESGGDKATQMAAKWALAVQKRSLEVNKLMLTAMSSNNANVTQSFALSLEAKDKDLTVHGNLLQDTANMEKAISDLKQKGVPLVDRSGVLLHLKADGGSATGSLYMAGQGNLLALVKWFLVDPAKADPDLKAAAELASSVQLTDSKLSGELKDGKISVKGYAQTSDLTEVAKALQKQMAPKLEATPLNARMEYTSSGGQEKGSLKVGFKQFMPGKSDADIKAAVADATHTSFQIKTNADTKEATLEPKLEKPSAEMASTLVAVKNEGDSSLFATSPLAGGGGAPPNIATVVGIALAVVVLLGMGMAASKKKP